MDRYEINSPPPTTLTFIPTEAQLIEITLRRLKEHADDTGTTAMRLLREICNDDGMWDELNTRLDQIARTAATGRNPPKRTRARSITLTTYARIHEFIAVKEAMLRGRAA